MILNLFDLHKKEDNAHSWIWIEINISIIRRILLDYFKKNSRNKIARIISKRLNCGFSTVAKHISRLIHNEKLNLPLPVMGELIELIGPKVRIKAIKSINSFWSVNDKTKKRIKVPYKINRQLAKIIGAHMADGYLQKVGHSYGIKVSDGRKDNIDIFKNWLKERFNLEPRIRFDKTDNTWTAWYSNKIIGRYYEKIFHINHGKKFHIAKEPLLIKNSSITIRNAFALGVMTFDGGVKTSGMVSIVSRSKKLIRDLEEIFNLNHIKINKRYNSKKESWLLEGISGRDIGYLQKWQNFFERGTWKRERLDFFIKRNKCTIKELEYLFPKHHLGKLCISDIWDIINQIKKGKANDIRLELNKRHDKVANTTLYKYLFILEKSNLIKKENLLSTFQGYGQREVIYSLR